MGTKCFWYSVIRVCVYCYHSFSLILNLRMAKQVIGVLVISSKCSLCIYTHQHTCTYIFVCIYAHIHAYTHAHIIYTHKSKMYIPISTLVIWTVDTDYVGEFYIFILWWIQLRNSWFLEKVVYGLWKELENNEWKVFELQQLFIAVK